MRFEDSLAEFDKRVRARGQGEHFEVNLARVLTTRREAAPPLVHESEAFAVALRETALSVSVLFADATG